MNNELQYLQDTQDYCDFSIPPITDTKDFQNPAKYKKLDIDKSQVSMLTQSVLPAAASGTLANAYYVSFPAGVPHTLMKYKTGGYGSPIVSNGIVGHAAFHPLTATAAFMGVFTVLSAVTGQYYLAEINSKLDKISQKVSSVLNFLYGDKKAELVSELSFVQYAQKNYASIMLHEQQQIATICGIQNAKKVAVKDIEFYLNDLNNTVGQEIEKPSQWDDCITQTIQIHNSLELSMQLYLMCCILEVYYSQNFEHDYLESIINSASEYVALYRDMIRTSISRLKGRIDEARDTRFNKFDFQPRKDQVTKLLAALPSGENTVRQQLHDALYAPLNKTEIFMTTNGEAFCYA